MLKKLALGAVLLCGCAATAASEKPTLDDLARVTEGVSASAVRIEFTLQHDRGDAPSSNNQWMAYQMRSSSQPWMDWEDYEEVIRQERPLERGGYILSPTQVVTTDLTVHPRFIKQIQVRRGDQRVDAELAGYSLEGSILHLALAAPIEGTPLTFDADAEGPFYAAAYIRWNGTWQVGLAPATAAVAVGDDGRRYAAVEGGPLFITRDGTAVGMASRMELPIDGSWKGSPLHQPMITRAELDTVLEKTEALAALCLPRVELAFRSPRSDQSSGYYGYGWGYGGENSETEYNGTCILVDESHILVPASFKADKTARLEGIRVHTPDGDTVEATFAGSLKDYGGFLAELESPLPGAAVFFDEDMINLREKMLAEAQITIHGEHRTAYYDRQRVSMFQVGWQGRDFPMASPVSSHSGGYYGYRGTSSGLNFLFTLEGKLVGIPIARRQKVTVADRWGGDGPIMVPASFLKAIIADPEDHLDPDNRPLTEEEEDRIAWLGIEMQSMTPDLARLNEITHLTSGGSTGALITYVYDNSPASEKGLEMGDILLRLHVEGHPKPLDVNVGDHYNMYGDDFWDYIDEMPVEYFDRMPSPWGSVDNSLTRAITELGYGTPFTAEIYRNGETIRIDFIVEQGPPYYTSAKRYKSEDLGFTVRELTYEVRRYYQLTEDAPGVIVSKIEPGEKAAIAGLRPYELIINVDEQPVSSPDEFEAAIQAAGDRKLLVKRMTEGRIVKITVDEKEAEPEEAEPAAPEEAGADE